MIDPILFKDLLKADPEEIQKRSGALYDSGSGTYTLRFWGKSIHVDPGKARVVSSEYPLDDDWAYVPLAVIHYLLSVNKKEQKQGLDHEWISEKDIPGGSAFFRGPHTLPAQDIARRFEQDAEGFARVCRANQGKELKMADVSFKFDLLPVVPAAVLLWLRDEEFEGEARLLFDRSIGDHLPLDIIYAIAVTLCKTLS